MIDYIDIINIAIHNDFKRMGIASELLNSVEEFARNIEVEKISLEVNVNNEAAINLYKKFGYKEVRLIKNYYDRLKEDAYLMQKEL